MGRVLRVDREPGDALSAEKLQTQIQTDNLKNLGQADHLGAWTFAKCVGKNMLLNLAVKNIVQIHASGYPS